MMSYTNIYAEKGSNLLLLKDIRGPSSPVLSNVDKLGELSPVFCQTVTHRTSKSTSPDGEKPKSLAPIHSSPWPGPRFEQFVGPNDPDGTNYALTLEVHLQLV